MARISKFYRIIISAFLALLGFSCSNGGTINLPVEYGVPSATYKVKGVVVSETDDSPIEGIRVTLSRNSSESNAEPYAIAADYTDSEGSFYLTGSDFPMLKLYVQLTDVDGETNGSFAAMETVADFTDATFTGGSGGWYSGEAEIDLGTIKMQPQ